MSATTNASGPYYSFNLRFEFMVVPVEALSGGFSLAGIEV
jgi:hypothetical protein